MRKLLFLTSFVTPFLWARVALDVPWEFGPPVPFAKCVSLILGNHILSWSVSG